ncbi:hypothetical protein LEP3755_65640 (plasmid) [Leptolyngbya sp. NIES-3755]|nr:hypothetical protein LEP3755_65640 [Leptolyngbya sp. NIES-3755]
MGRPKKNPVNGMPVTEVTPVMGEPGLFEKETNRTKGNVVPITTSSQPIQAEHDWSTIDAVLSDVVNFV